MPHALYEGMMVVYGNENNKIVPYFMPSIFVRDDSLSSLFSFLYNARSIKRAHRLFVWSRISTHVHEILSRTRDSCIIYGEGKILILWFLCDLSSLSRIGPNELLFYLLCILINQKNNHIQVLSEYEILMTMNPCYVTLQRMCISLCTQAGFLFGFPKHEQQWYAHNRETCKSDVWDTSNR